MSKHEIASLMCKGIERPFDMSGLSEGEEFRWHKGEHL